ncbi:MAG: hypothetical protein DRG50_00190 [Deltaproteobacteria bacterium]|nr:MAG: hypothetical protein DRG50_00190 [Deltaproteobacteria bacterium]
MEGAIQNIFGMYFIMMAAYFLKKRSPYPVGVVNNLVFNFFLPVTIFYSIVQIQNIQPSAFTKLALSGFVVLLLTYFLALMILRPLALRDSFKKTFLLGASYGNHAFLGFPVAFAFLENKGVVLAIFFLIGGYFFLYTIGFYIMTGKMTLSAFSKNPLVISMTAGLLCLLFRLPIPQLLSYSLSLMNKATFPLAMVVVGGGLSLKFFGQSKNILYTLLVSLIKLVISPLIAFALGSAFSLSTDQLAISILQSAMPAAVLVTVFSVKYKGDDAFSNSIISFTTLASIGTIPLLIFLLKQMR